MLTLAASGAVPDDIARRLPAAEVAACALRALNLCASRLGDAAPDYVSRLGLDAPTARVDEALEAFARARRGAAETHAGLTAEGAAGALAREFVVQCQRGAFGGMRFGRDGDADADAGAGGGIDLGYSYELSTAVVRANAAATRLIASGERAFVASTSAPNPRSRTRTRTGW